MIEVSAKACHAILYLITDMPWQYPLRLGMLFYILSRLGILWGLACLSRLGSICLRLPRLGMLFYILSRPGSICRGLQFYILSRLCSIHPGLLFYIFSRLGSIHLGLACYSISYHALVVSSKAWHAILYLPWQHLPRLGMLFYILLVETQVEQTETCRRAGSERYLVNMLRRI